MSIIPKQQTINELFSVNKSYYIDFYQRDYQWRKEHVEKLLEDLFYRFNLEYKPNVDITDEVISNYDWYYLNSYVTNEYNGNTYIVDGQQRLTTITLILIKLRHLAFKFEMKYTPGYIEEHITGKTKHGLRFWMGDGDREKALEDLFNNASKTIDDLADNDISIKNMYQNYQYISDLVDDHLNKKHKLDAFISFFLSKVLLIKTEISETKDVPMVFEVINDRGERLKPYEVLKGKLLGQIDKTEIDKYHGIWQKHVHDLQGLDEWGADKPVDEFFRTFFRAKYVDNRTDYKKFDGDYHKTVYEEKWNSLINLKQNSTEVKRFIIEELDYFAPLYIEIVSSSKLESSLSKNHLYYNELNDQDRQFLMILSACDKDDPLQTEKIKLVSRLFDKHFALLQLTGAYDSNKFTISLVELNKNIRSKSPEEIENIYEKQILEDISSYRSINLTDPFEWNSFKEVTNHNFGIRFIRYFLARIERFIGDEIGKVRDNYNNLVKNTGHVNGYHLEHILANNEENLEVFGNDEEKFFTERNKLGALLLLKGSENLSSGNEKFSDKLKTYSGSLLWNETLRDDLYHRNPDFMDFMKKYNLEIKPYKTFDSKAILERQQLLFKIARQIWLD